MNWLVVWLTDPDFEDGTTHYVKPGHPTTVCGLETGEGRRVEDTELPLCRECVTLASLQGYTHPLVSA